MMAGGLAAAPLADPFFTIGHSTRSIGEFVTILISHGIKRVVDVRRIPRSRHNAQYDSIRLAQILAELQIGYQHIPALGGRRASSMISRKT